MKPVILTFAAIAVSGCGAMVEALPLEQKLAMGADYFNKEGNSHFHDAFPTVEVSGRVDDGDTLVLRIENFPSGTMTYDPNAIRKRLRPDVCEPPLTRSIVDDGGKIRMEIQSNYGKELPPVQFARC